MRRWLVEALAPIRAELAGACLFGSVLSPHRSPRDVDLALIAADGAGGASWRRVRRHRDAMLPEFLERFGLPLSAKVVTSSEWDELRDDLFAPREALWEWTAPRGGRPTPPLRP